MCDTLRVCCLAHFLPLFITPRLLAPAVEGTQDLVFMYGVNVDLVTILYEFINV
jgi:hypothetical protein